MGVQSIEHVLMAVAEYPTADNTTGRVESCMRLVEPTSCRRQS